MKDGFYGGSRRRAGTEFEMDEADIGRTKGEEGAEFYKYPTWVRAATDLNRRLHAKHKEVAEEKFIRAAIASSGTAGQKAKAKSFNDAMRDGTDAGAEAAGAALSGTRAKKAAYEAARDSGRGPQTTIK